jgi:uncharacterized protein (DUF2252 family)
VEVRESLNVLKHNAVPLKPFVTVATKPSLSSSAFPPVNPVDRFVPAQGSALGPVLKAQAKQAVSPAGRSNVSATGSQQSLVAQHVAGNLSALPGAAAVAAGAVDLKAIRDPQTAVRFVKHFNTELDLPQATLAVKNKLMASSPAKFLRVNPALFYQDLKGPYASRAQLLKRAAPQITIDGDAHLGNFGTVRNAKGDTIWGLNDYDMAAKGSPEADLERLATSIILFGKDAGMSKSDCLPLIDQMVKGYANAIDRHKNGDPPENAGIRVGKASGVVKDFLEKQSGVTQEDMLSRFASKSHGGFTELKRNDELKDPTSQDHQLVADCLANYDKTQGKTPDLQRPIKMLDVACRVESGGSTYGLKRYYALLQGTDKLPIILEIKQELPSAPVTASGDLSKADMPKIFKGMQAMGGVQNPLMAQATLDKGAFFIREREREKGSIDPTKLKPEQWKDLCEQAGEALAKAHAHQPGAGQDIAKWIGSDEEALSQNLQSFAVDYAKQTEQDTAAYAQSLSK